MPALAEAHRTMQPVNASDDFTAFVAGRKFKTILADPPGSFKTAREKWRRSTSV